MSETSAETKSVDPRFARLCRGEPLTFAAPTNDRAETAAETEARTIPAQWIAELIARGNGVVNVPLTISHAILDGALDCKHAEFSHDVAITESAVTGSVNFSFAAFKRSAIFQGTRFLNAVNFRATTVDADLVIAGATIGDGSRFHELRVNRVLDARGAQFDNVEFDRAAIDSNALFHSDDKRRRTTFRGRAGFQNVRFGADADFEGAEFAGPASFRSSHVFGDAYFGADTYGNRTTFVGAADFRNAHVAVDVVFSATEFKADLDFEGLRVDGDAFFATRRGMQTVFGGEVVFLGAVIKGNADFEGAEFRSGVTFESAKIGGDAFFRPDDRPHGVIFAADVDFRSAHVGGNAEFDGTAFKGAARFWDMIVDGTLSFRATEAARTVFVGAANFQNARCNGDAAFTGANFNVNAVFDRAKVGGDAYFGTVPNGYRTTFGGNATFLGTEFGTSVNFQGARFVADADFRGLRVGVSAFFRTDSDGNRTSFGGRTNFLGADITRNLEFTGAEFHGEVTFDAMHVGGDAHFHRDKATNPVTFAKGVNFRSVAFGTDALFSRAVFKGDVAFDHACVEGRADFEEGVFASGSRASFVRVRFKSGADFSKASFESETDYGGAVIERDADFSNASFLAPVQFNDARFESVLFGKLRKKPGGGILARWKQQPELENLTKFGGPVDFRGLTYERIYVRLQDLFPKLEPFDRQPYSRLEAFYHDIGEDARATDVYLERRRVERRSKLAPRTLHTWAADWLYKVTANYGVRPFRLIAYSLAILWFGAVLFAQPGALEHKEQKPGTVMVAPTAGDGRDVSIRYFLPIDSPLGSDLVPVARPIPIRLSLGSYGRSVHIRPDWYATFSRMAGTALVGLALAAVTGLLRRIAH